MGTVVVFAPSPLLTVTIEDHPDGADVHVHAGGQGVWQATMLRRLGAEVVMCCVLTGEGGDILRRLIAGQGIRVAAVDREGRSGAYVHDRRGGERTVIGETAGDPLPRHVLDELYGVTLREGLAADLAILSGPAGDDVLPPDVYRRLAADLGSKGVRVVVDLAGDRLDAALEGAVSVAKVSEEELLEHGRISTGSTEQIVAAMRHMAANTVVVTRADRPFLVLHDGVLSEVTPPPMEVADTKGAGDSLTAGISAALAGGATVRDAVLLGAAADALNVTRHGLGTGDREAIERLRELVTVRELEAQEPERVSPDDLATRVEEVDG